MQSKIINVQIHHETMSKVWDRQKKYCVELATKHVHVQRGQDNYRMKRLQSNRDVFLSGVSEIESWILENFSKMDSEYDSREFYMSKMFPVDNRLKHQQKSEKTLPGIRCWGPVHVGGIHDCYYRHNLPDDYGYIHIYGTYSHGVYRLGSRVTWYPNNFIEYHMS